MKKRKPEGNPFAAKSSVSEEAVHDESISESATQTTWEVEQKYVIQDHGLLSEKLAENEFQRLRVEQHEDIYFQHPCRDFRQTDEAFRLRRQDHLTVITYKGKRLEAAVKTRPEIELDIDAKQFTEWQQMLENLGFQPVGRIRKQRTVYGHGNEDQSVKNRMIVSSDEVQGLGDFAEIELLVTDPKALTEARTRIEAMAAKLSLSQVQPLSYLAQVLAKQGRG